MIEDLQSLEWTLSNIKMIESQINFVINDLLLKITTYCKDK